MLGRFAVANMHRERTEEEQLAHDKDLLNEVVSEQASRMRHLQNLSLERLKNNIINEFFFVG